MDTNSLPSQRKLKGENTWREQHGDTKVGAKEGGGRGGALGLGAEILLQSMVKTVVWQTVAL